MKLQRDDEIVTVNDENVISAFKEAGYVEVKEEEKKTPPRKTTKTKA